MAHLTLTVETIVEVPNQPFTAVVKRVVNSVGNDITVAFLQFAQTHDLALESQIGIAEATLKFCQDQANALLLP